MNEFNCNFHNHTVLSPCADISMTPDIYIDYLSKYGIDWIAITDHNSSRNNRIYMDIISKHGIKIIPGIEVQTIEEIHVLIYFKDIAQSEHFGNIIENNLTIQIYDPEKLGYQIVIDKNGEFNQIIESPYLGSSSKFTVEEVFKISKNYESLIIPAHIFRMNGLIYNLGFPPNLDFDAVEIKNEKELLMAKKLGFKNFIFGEDSHFPEALNDYSCKVICNNRSFEELKKSIKENKVIPKWQL